MTNFFSRDKKTSIVSIAILFLIILFSIGYNLKNKNPENDISFRMLAVGDFGETKDTEMVLKKMASYNPDYYMALGDLHYYGKLREEEWCNLAKSYIGEKPFELIVGNHESGNGDSVKIDNFVKCLPNKISTIVGDYGKKYYFDYPEQKPILRMINIDPAITYADGSMDKYDRKSPSFLWLMNAIDEAKNNGIPWVIVAYHKSCMSYVARECEVGIEFVQTLLDKKVDMIIGGHNHVYTRTKPLSCVDGKGTLAVFKQGCIVENKLEKLYTQGNGTVMLTLGTGGQSLTPIVKDSLQSAYFTQYMGQNIMPTFGFGKFDISKDFIRFEFVPVKEGGFSDNFVITK